MFEIFRMQLGQMLGGRMKWLVLLSLTLPVLLTLAVVSSGGFDELHREFESDRSMQAYARGVLPSTAERVRWPGEDLTFGEGRWALTLTRRALLVRGREASEDRVIVVDGGRFVVLDGELWMDPAVEPGRRRWNIRTISRRDSDLAFDSRGDLTLATICAIYLFMLYPQAICLLLALFYGTSVLGSELDGKTLTYLFVRPLPRWKFVVGKYLGIVTALAVPANFSLLASWVILGAEGGLALFGGMLLGTIGALIAYNAVFIFFGFLLPRRAMITALLYGLIFELVLSFVPALVNQFTITYYLRSLVVEILDLEVPHEIARIVGGASIPGALLALTAIVGVTLALSSILASRREYLVKDRV